MIGPILKPKRSTRSKYKSRPRDVDYMLWVKSLPCSARLDVLALIVVCVGGEPEWFHVQFFGDARCEGPIEADHMGRRGMGRKASDATCAPLCTLHHRQRTDHSGPWRNMDQATARAFCEDVVAYTQQLARAAGIEVPE